MIHTIRFSLSPPAKGRGNQPRATGLDLSALRPMQRVQEQEFAQSLAVMTRIHRKAVEAHARNASRQPPAPSLRQMAAIQLGQGQGVEAADARRFGFKRGDEGF